MSSPGAGDWTQIANTTRRGFTDHTTLDNVNLVHMNGRVYDPALGRMISADPFVADPENTQNYNRYSYVNNRPLSLTDPSGFFPSSYSGQICYQNDPFGAGVGWLDAFNIQASFNIGGWSFGFSFSHGVSSGSSTYSGPGGTSFMHCDPIGGLGGPFSMDWRQARVLTDSFCDFAYKCPEGPAIGQSPEELELERERLLIQAERDWSAFLWDYHLIPICQEQTSECALRNQLATEASIRYESSGRLEEVRPEAYLMGGLGGWRAAGRAAVGEMMTLARASGILRSAATGRGNFGLGKATVAEANALGNAWVGPGARLSKDGSTLVSRDGLRTYRPPSSKDSSLATTGVQANFERFQMIGGKKVPTGNGHLDIVQ